SHKNPKAPTLMNAPRHSQIATMGGTTKGVRIAPIFVPALKMPVARARSFFGNHSVTALMLAGNTAASPKPRATLHIAKEVSGEPIAVHMEAKLQNAMASA